MTETSFHENSVAIIPATSDTIAPDNLNASFVSLINLSPITFCDPNESLKDYLSHDIDKLIVLCNFEKSPNKILSDEMRTVLVKQVIDREVNIALRDANFQVGKEPLKKFVIDRSRFLKLANEIATVFNEESGLYYTPYYQEGDVSVNPSGKLWERFNEVKKKMRDAGILQSNPKPVKNSKSVVVANANTIEKIEWLKKNVQPVDQVKDYWRETFDVRQSNWKNENKAESSPFIYECLKTDLGVDLIDIDFKRIQQKVKDDCIDSNWPKVAKSIRKYYSVNEQFVPTATAKKLLGLHSNISEDKDEIILLLLLTCILDNTSANSATVKKVGKKRKNLCGESPPQKVTKDSEDLSQVDLTNDFLSIVKIETQVQEIIDKKKSTALAEKKTVQPYMLFVGTPEKCTSFYVVVDNYKYKVVDAFAALKLNFQIFFVWNLQFPKSCNNTWVFIQKSIFEISTVGNKYPAKVNKMFTYVKRTVEDKN
ncbi:uncharacterized protein LOC123270748 [Cotesia glomerata]|uniref:Uncharacterized protein n=1 Tax=Cotesia glomerata TaxID=32391 RepID=A0AAV7IIW5_COTGL|nr:uncharacterized protein LOC123270748 [Cotesia glomerata]KAH0551965.1 hypothetical protein KQX54_003565 [Cotesia glomerata]